MKNKFIISGLLSFVFLFVAGYSYYLLNKPSDDVMCGMNNLNNININWIKPKAETQINIVEDKSKCQSSNKNCKIQLSDKRWISLELLPKPVVSRKSLLFKVKTSDKTITPQLIDIVGVNINMGYLRPELKKVDDLNYQLDFILPFCEEEKMQWKATVHFKDDKAPSLTKGALFYFQSIQ